MTNSAQQPPIDGPGNAEEVPPPDRSGEQSAESDWGDAELHIEDPAGFIAAVPALLGFVPRRSLVVCLLHELPDRPGAVVLGAVARHDLDVSDASVWSQLAAQLATLCARERVTGVLALIVDDRLELPGSTRGGPLDAPHREVVRVLDAALGEQRIALTDAWAVRTFAAEAMWWSLDDSADLGAQRDPSASPIAMAHVLDGRPLRTSRAELIAVVAIDGSARDEVTDVLAQATAAARDRMRRARCRGEIGSHQRAQLEMVWRRVGAVAAGARPDPGQVADIVVALRDSMIREAVFGMATGDRATAAEELWAQLCRSLTGSDRARAAVLLGYSAYLRGDGPLAGVALDAALDADPDHTVARLLDTALRSGVRPQEVRRLAIGGRKTAAGLGVDLDVDPAARS